MTYLAKPKLHHPDLPKNALGFTRRDYEGPISTLCAGCGHDSISAAIIQAFYELAIEPHKVAKLSGIGCSSKTPTYFLGQSHGFNSVHGRMPSVLTGANLANRDLIYLGVSGDGDSASIGLGQFAHVMRRGVNMVYIVENNGVYGLTKGQFSATADKGSKAKRGNVNNDAPIDLVQLALQLGATFVARGFSGDKAQLVPLIKAAVEHRGRRVHRRREPVRRVQQPPGLDQELRLRPRAQRGGQPLDFVSVREPITAAVPPGGVQPVTLHDGGTIRLRKLHPEYDAHDKVGALAYVEAQRMKGEVVTGLLYVEDEPVRSARHAEHRRRAAQYARRRRPGAGQRRARELQRVDALTCCPGARGSETRAAAGAIGLSLARTRRVPPFGHAHCPANRGHCGRGSPSSLRSRSPSPSRQSTSMRSRAPSGRRSRTRQGVTSRSGPSASPGRSRRSWSSRTSHSATRRGARRRNC